VQISRDFGVAFWIIAPIDFFDFQLDSCTVRVPSNTECILLLKIESSVHFQVEVQAQRFPIVRHPGYRVVSICPQVKPAGTIAAFVRRNSPATD
jgi:hypothetical protein